MTDHELVAQLYQKYAQTLLKYLISSLRERQDAEDVLVEVFLAALEYRGLARLNEYQQFAWLLSVARHKVADWYRATKRLSQASLDQMTPFLQEPVSKEDQPETIALKREEYALLQRLIMRLPKTQQDVLQLRFICGLRHAEIASLLNKTEGGVQVIFSRAIRALRVRYQQETGRRMVK